VAPQNLAGEKPEAHRQRQKSGQAAGHQPLARHSRAKRARFPSGAGSLALQGGKQKDQERFRQRGGPLRA